jgi:Mn-dependent DtxR family transcriptional regulator
MRRSAGWMSAPDDRILEIAAEDEDGVTKVGNVADNPYIHVGNSQVSVRCKKLAEHGLLRAIGDGVYVITDEGRGYLDEKYDVKRGVWLDCDQAEGGSGPSASEELNDV